MKVYVCYTATYEKELEMSPKEFLACFDNPEAAIPDELALDEDCTNTVLEEFTPMDDEDEEELERFLEGSSDNHTDCLLNLPF